MTMIQVPEGMAVITISNRKNVMLTTDIHLSSHLADYVL